MRGIFQHLFAAEEIFKGYKNPLALRFLQSYHAPRDKTVVRKHNNHKNKQLKLHGGGGILRKIKMEVKTAFLVARSRHYVRRWPQRPRGNYFLSNW